MFLNRIFYTLKPAIPRRVQIFFRRKIAMYKRKKYAHLWPIDPKSAAPPNGWNGWPNGKKFAFVLLHDIDTQKGHDKALKLAKLDEEFGFRASFNFVPERYTNSSFLHAELKKRGFDIGVHGLKHDGNLFRNRKLFESRAPQINSYLKKWKSTGFSAPSMHRNSDWLLELNIEHSISSFDTDPFEPQPNSVRTIFPFWVSNGHSAGGYLELPYTLPQDHLLFCILKEQNIKIWKNKLDWIAENGGMALLNTHADYINFKNGRLGNEEYPINHYTELLQYVARQYKDQYWQILPKEITRFWKENIIK